MPALPASVQPLASCARVCRTLPRLDRFAAHGHTPLNLNMPSATQRLRVACTLSARAPEYALVLACHCGARQALPLSPTLSYRAARNPHAHYAQALCCCYAQRR